VQVSELTMSRTKVYLFSVEGLIGAGKSTIIDKLQEITDNLLEQDLPFSVVTIRECLEEFTSFHGHNPLELSYENPIMNAPLAQVHFTQSINKVVLFKKLKPLFDSTMKQWKNDTLVVVTDRSLFSPLPFIQTLYANGRISGFAHDFLIDYTLRKAKDTLKSLNLQISGIYYVDTPIDICMTRVANRGRVFECEGGTVTRGYQKGLKREYEKHLLHWENRDICKDDVVAIKKCTAASAQDLLEFIKKTMM
jgi:deoxyadenosine/deoxycytidine kinase